MEEIYDVLSGIPLFSGVERASLQVLAGAGEIRCVSADELLYREGDAADGILVILEGSVELRSGAGQGLEEVFGTLGPGRILGMLALIDEGMRAATARAVEESRVLEIRREVFQELRQKSPVQWAEIIAALGGEMASQVRFLIERYRQCLAWNLQISAGSEISLASLAELSMEISITLIDGSSLRGRVLNVEKDTAAGWDMLFGADDGSLRIIPRHAVVQIMARQGNDDPVSG